MRMLLLGNVLVLLVILVSSLVVQSGRVWVALGLNTAHVLTGLLARWARRRVGSRRTVLEHCRVLDGVWLRSITRAVRSTIVLVLGVGNVVVVGGKGRRELLLWALTTSGLWLARILRRVLRGLGGGGR